MDHSDAGSHQCEYIGNKAGRSTCVQVTGPIGFRNMILAVSQNPLPAAERVGKASASASSWMMIVGLIRMSST